MCGTGIKSNYDTDVFNPIIREIEAISGKDYGENEKRYCYSCGF